MSGGETILVRDRIVPMHPLHEKAQVVAAHRPRRRPHVFQAVSLSAVLESQGMESPGPSPEPDARSKNDGQHRYGDHGHS